MKIGKVFFMVLIASCLLAANFFEVHAQSAEDRPDDSYYVDRVIEVNLSKEENIYKVLKLEVLKQVLEYQRSYVQYEGKVNNGTIFSFKGETLANFYAGGLKPSLCFDESAKSGAMSGECGEINNTKTKLTLPYFSNGKYADIYNPEGKKILTIDLSSKATCNENNNCDRPLEDSINCPSDCRENQPVVDKIPVQTGNVASQNAPKEQTGWWNSWGKLSLAILVVLLVGVGILVARRRSRARY